LRGGYFKGLLNCKEPEEVLNFNLEIRNDQDCIELIEEIRSQINNLKNHRSPGGDETR